MAPPRQCASCELALEPGRPYYRFAIAIEGEQDIIDTSGRDELKAVLSQLEAGPDDPATWEEQVHWERSGVVCPSCRERLISSLGGSTNAPH